MGLANYLDAIRRSEADATLTRLLFALELYHREHGETYPESLDKLRNGYVDEIPLDPFSKQPFLYILDDDRRGYLIYSVGANGIDNNGRNNNDTTKGDDVRRRIRLTAD
ncbi:MAG: type II secretion system protein GspG [Planctomycetaceae bacterium]|nr:type II secretion system protein GspG [Planctomycetaceae bacterium]